ncbi:hypothetical protein Misp01_24920 [Microtetraspora sp. NBRC 13810]|nr:hypothetical protein [Microtetraspora sp. NBRC 13810]GLW07362.1 hypothetical protein Misp01_24920 [Microtetraspora sp. NBRC 13810]
MDVIAARCANPPAAALLIRPDCHVAWAGDPTSTGSLAQALTAWFGPRSDASSTWDKSFP